jgi:hypothetical protein
MIAPRSIILFTGVEHGRRAYPSPLPGPRKSREPRSPRQGIPEPVKPPRQLVDELKRAARRVLEQGKLGEQGRIARRPTRSSATSPTGTPRCAWLV